MENLDKATGEKPVSLARLCYTILEAMDKKASLEAAQGKLIEQKLITAETINSINDQNALTNGDVFQVMNDILVNLDLLHLD